MDGEVRYKGITPACAGNSEMHTYELIEIKDHPRLRGEQYLRGIGAFLWRGSPPLARGTAFCALMPARLPRITPACAGNSIDWHTFAV